LRNMKNTAIAVRGLSKIYKIYDTPMDRLKEAFSPTRKAYSVKFTALSNIHFSVQQGEFLGVVGRNGAGKTTLLRILSGELGATAGHFEVNGAVSLLQLGVGFNRELNGVENIKFSAKLLGYDDRRTRVMIDEIVKFADLGDFIHHPVKMYSSGMYSRLSFAVGISVDPDILIADEVLAVGDIRFAAKCLRKMQEIKDRGTTVILVTHDVSKVAVFCDRAIWLKDGRIEAMGDGKEIAETYRDYMLLGDLPKKENDDTGEEEGGVAGKDLLPDVSAGERIDWIDLKFFSCYQKEKIKITHAALYSKEDRKKASVFSRGDKAVLYLKVSSETMLKDITVGWSLADKQGLIACHTNSGFYGKAIETINKGDEIFCYFDLEIPPLRNSSYIFSLGIKQYEDIIFKANDVLPLQIQSSDPFSKQGGYVIVENCGFDFQIN